MQVPAEALVSDLLNLRLQGIMGSLPCLPAAVLLTMMVTSSLSATVSQPPVKSFISCLGFGISSQL